MESFLKLASFLIIYAGVVDASLCKTFNPMLSDASVPQEGSTNAQNGSAVVVYSCPGDSDPGHYTECCSREEGGCCSPARYFYEIDRTLATTIAVSVTSLCILFTAIITVCCFWSRCPLYSACRTQYSHDVATYVSKSDEIDMTTMPREISAKEQKFIPKNISNGNLPVGETDDLQK